MIAKLHEQLTAKTAAFAQLSAKRSELTNELNRVKLQSAAGAAVLDDPRLIAGNYERPTKRARVTGQCKESSTTPSTPLFSALLAEREDYENRCEALTFENQCIPALFDEA